MITQTHVASDFDAPSTQAVMAWVSGGATHTGLSILGAAVEEARSHGPECANLELTILLRVIDMAGKVSHIAVPPALSSPGCVLGAIMSDPRCREVYVVGTIYEGEP